MPENNEIKVKQLEFPLDWVVPDHIVARYATNMVVQHGENEFFISFFEVKELYNLAYEQKAQARIALRQYRRIEARAKQMDAAYRSQLGLAGRAA